MEWKMERISKRMQLQLTCVTGAAYRGVSNRWTGIWNGTMNVQSCIVYL